MNIAAVAALCLTLTSLAAPVGARERLLRSLRDWAVCDGETDDTAAVRQAVGLASGNAFVLLVDCPVFVHVKNDIARPIFIESDTEIRFSGNGEMKIDNVFVPGFAIVNARHVTLLDWRVRYVGEIPIEALGSTYLQNGGTVTVAARIRPESGAFNDTTLKTWLTTHRGVRFQNVNPLWSGPVDAAAIFYFRGSASNIDVEGMKIYVAPDATPRRFVPTAFSFSRGEKDDAGVARETNHTAERFAVPTDVKFNDVDLDGVLMGWQGVVQHANFERIRSHRYADLQDDEGTNVGGVNKWFAPPHLFYLNYQPDPPLESITRNIRIADVVDSGPRVGAARDTDPSKPRSGYANSLKIGGEYIAVEDYNSNRPDGWLDLLPSRHATFRRIRAEYDSSFLHNLYPALRFPGGPMLPISDYSDVEMENIRIIDRAESPRNAPMWPSCLSGNRNIFMRDIQFELKRWSGPSEELERMATRFCGTNIYLNITIRLAAPDAEGHTVLETLQRR